MPAVSDEALLELIVAADDKAFAEGVPPNGRWLPVISEVMSGLGYQGYVLSGVGRSPMVERISALHRSLYRPSDIGMGALHGGIFMFRDVFARVHVPIVFGTVSIDAFKLTDLTPMQLKWLGRRPEDMAAFLDQFADIFDYGGGIGNLGDYKRPPDAAMPVFRNAAFQLQSAAAALSVAFDYRGAVQSALIGAELALKGGLAALGDDEEALRKHGHKLKSAAQSLASRYSAFDLDRVLKVISGLPNYVDNRYSASQPHRTEVGHIVMGAQYIAGEVMRQVTGHTIRDDRMPSSGRVYPPL
jgi:hypothetical protein